MKESKWVFIKDRVLDESERAGIDGKRGMWFGSSECPWIPDYKNGDTIPSPYCCRINCTGEIIEGTACPEMRELCIKEKSLIKMMHVRCVAGD